MVYKKLYSKVASKHVLETICISFFFDLEKNGTVKEEKGQDRLRGYYTICLTYNIYIYTMPFECFEISGLDS